MQWSRFTWLLAVILVIGLLLIGYFRFTQGVIKHELQELQSEIEARDDGSYLRFEGLNAKGKTALLDEMVYFDGKKNERFSVYGLSIDGNLKTIHQLKADHFAWRGSSGEVATFDHLSVKNMRENQDAKYGWDSYVFERLQASNLFMRGLTQAEIRADLRAEQLAFIGMGEETLDEAWLRNVELTHSSKARAKTQEIRIEALEYGKIEDVFASIEAGYLPLAPLSEYADLDVRGFSLELDGQEFLDNNDTQLAEEQMLEFFMKNAPEKLQDFIGTTNGKELRGLLEELENKDSNELAIDALEFMLDFLKSNQN